MILLSWNQFTELNCFICYVFLVLIELILIYVQYVRNFYLLPISINSLNVKVAII